MNVIYKISSPSGKCYIGRTDNFDRRMAQHKHNAFTKKLKFALYNAIRKYGWDNMKREIICEVDDVNAQKIEEELIIANNTVKKGYNSTYSGGGGNLWKGLYDTDEYIQFCQKMKKINSANHMHNKYHSETSKQLMRQKSEGRFTLDWFINKYGKEDGTVKYEERRTFLKNRSLKKDKLGRFIKK